ncbi:hypothetical protein K3757_16885 [Sulfitobacter sp. S223]|uniref:hypothetical protein n=1 Tax=Sulfitobacter sp. S223 TaxID=2867023 RepID=UPI0021A93315|nr:hypothetical protein [Sulfitobacter sp. S223]UWR26093.1 hypothetical protein K3757_16885 [Sulfitobacter sp. S223]
MIKQAAILAAGLAVNVTAVLAEARPVPEKVEFMFDGATVNIAAMAPEASRYAAGSEKEFRSDILKALGARAFEDVFNFTDAQSLVVYDSGPTQNDAETLIRYLLAAGYLSEKKSPLSWRPASVARSWSDSSGMML